MAFDVEGARKAGYSDEQIADYLGQQSNFDVSGAAKAGYGYGDIINHLVSKAPKKAEPTPPPPEPEADTGSDFLRGLGNVPGQVQETFGAAKALTGVTFGSKELAKSGLETMKAGAAKQTSKETDSFTNAWNQGLWTVATDWLPYQIGAGAGTLAETLAFMGLGGIGGGASTGGAGAIPGAVAGVVGKQMVKSGIKQAAEELVRAETKKLVAEGATKEAAKIAAAQVGKEFIEAEGKKILADITTQAAKEYAKAGGKKAGLMTMAGMHGAGEVGGRAFEEAEKAGLAPEDIELSKAIPAAAVHAVADYAAEKIGLGALKVSGKSLGNWAMDVLKQIAVSGTKEVPAELIQTIAERYGASLSLSDAEAVKEYVDTVAASYGMMAAPGAVGGTRTRLAHSVEDYAKKQKDELEKLKLESTSATGEGSVLEPSAPQADASLVTALQPSLDDTGKAFTSVSTDTTKAGQVVKEQEALAAKTEQEKRDHAQGLIDKAAAGERITRPQIVEAARALGVKFSIDDRSNESKLAKLKEHLGGAPSATGAQQQPAGTDTTVAAQPKSTAGQPAATDVGGAGAVGKPATTADAGKKTQPAALTSADLSKLTDSELADRLTENTILGGDDAEFQLLKQERDRRKAAAPAEPVITPDIQARREKLADMIAAGKTDGKPFKTMLTNLNALEKAAGVPLTKGTLSAKREEDTLTAAMKMMQEQEKQEKASFEQAYDESLMAEPTDYEISKEDQQLYNETRDEVNAVAKARNAKRSELIAQREAARQKLKDVQSQIDELPDDATAEQQNKLDEQEEAATEAVRAADRAIEEHGPELRFLPEYSKKLEPHMKDVYFGNITAGVDPKTGRMVFGSGRNEHRKAAVELQKYLAKIGGSEKEEMSSGERRIVNHYEEARSDMTKMFGVVFPRWADLNAKQRNAYLQEIINNAGIQQQVGFGALAEELANTDMELTPEQKRALLKNIAIRRRQQKQFAENARQTAELQEKYRRSLPKEGRLRLPDNVIKMITDNNLQGVLQYLRSRPVDKFTTPYKRISNALAQSLFELKLNTKIKMVESSEIDGDLAQYDPETDTILMTREGLTEDTILHEVVHAGTIKILDIYLNGNRNLLTPEQIAACQQLETIMNETRSELIESYPNAYQYGKDGKPNLFEFVSYALTSPAMQEDLHDLSSQYHDVGRGANKLMNFLRKEAWAENIDTILPKEKSQWSAFKLSVASILKLAKTYLRRNKLRSDVEANFPMEIMAAFDDILAKPEGGIILPPMAAKEEKAKTHGAKLGRDDETYHLTKDETPRPFRKFATSFKTTEGIQYLARKFQDDRYAVKAWERTRDMAGKVIREGKDKINNIYEQIVLAAGDARNFYNVYISEAADMLDRAVGDFAKAAKYDTKRALEELHKITEAIHEPERRIVKYLLSVPLSNKDNITHNGKKISASQRRDDIIKLLDTKTLSEAQAKQLRNELDSIVFQRDANGNLVLDQYGYPTPNMKYVDAYGSGPRTKTKTDKSTGTTSVIQQATDITNEQYNATGMDINDAKAIRDAIPNHPQAMQIQMVLASLQKLHKETTSLNKLASYWSQPVSNRVAFYGFQNYVPLKGNPKHSEVDEDIDFDSRKNGRELQDNVGSMDGRFSVSKNPVLQTMTDATRAALRAGRRNLTQSIKNAIVNKDANGNTVLAGKIKKTIKFEERNTVDLSELKGETTIFHYNADGSIDVLVVADKKLRDSIRRTYKKSSPLVDFANKWTSRLGQMHTRYNYQFAPMNFVRDTLTNAWNIGASELGPIEAAKYLGDVALQVTAKAGMYKAMQVSLLYQKGDEKSLRALSQMAKEDPYIRDMVEYIRGGGMVTHLQGMSLQSSFEELHKKVGKSGIVRDVETLNQFLDTWTNMFELASRGSAYGVAKNNFKKQGMSEKEATTKALVFTKNLANFEQVGDLGRAMGAFYMFFRPSATGAVRAMEALAPAFPFSAERAEMRLPPEIANDPAAKAQYMKNYTKLRRNARISTASLFGLGMLAYAMAQMTADDDDLGRNAVATDNMEQWTRFARFHIPQHISEMANLKGPVVIQIPWGFGLGAFSAAGAQMASVGAGAQPLSSALVNIFTSIMLDSFIPIPVSRINPSESPENFAAFVLDSVMPSPLRPVLEFVMNKNGLGQDITSASQRRLGDAYTAGDNVPEMWKDAARWLHDTTDGFIDWSPNTMYFLSNSYVDGISRIFETGYGITDLASGQKDFNIKQDVPLFGSFFGTRSSYDAREFAKVEKKIQEKERILNDFKTRPGRYEEYLAAHPMDDLVVTYYNTVLNQELNPLRAEDKSIRLDPNLPANVRKDLLRINSMQENMIKRQMIEMFKSYGVER